MFAVLYEHMIQCLDLGGERILRQFAAAADLIQHLPTRRQIGLGVLVHVGHNYAQYAAWLQRATAFGKEARPFGCGLEMLEVMLDVNASRRSVGERKAPPAIDTQGDARRGKEVEVDPPFPAERTAAHIDQQLLLPLQGAALGDPAGMDVVEQAHHHGAQFDAEGAEDPRIDR